MKSYKYIVVNYMFSSIQLRSDFTNPFTPRSNYNSRYNVSSENLALDQLIIPKFIIFFILVTYLADNCIDIVRRNSVLVTHGS